MTSQTNMAESVKSAAEFEDGATGRHAKTPRSRSLGVGNWSRAVWFRGALLGFVALSEAVGAYSGASSTYLLGQFALGIAVLASLAILANRPLINPIQAFVVCFYWWFGVGPTIIATWDCMIGLPTMALEAQESGVASLGVVVPGLILYAATARVVDWLFSKTRIHAGFLRPEGDNYSIPNLTVCFALGATSTLMIEGLRVLGIDGREEVGFLGGTKTTIWWVGVIAGIGVITPFVNSAIMTYLATPWKKIPTTIRVLGILAIIETIQAALLGGWKSPLAYLGAYYVCAYVSQRQRPPWPLMIGGAIVFVGVIAPFVTYGRSVAVMDNATTSKDRQKVLKEVLKESDSFLPTNVRALDVGVLFRGIYPVAGELARRNSLWKGEWRETNTIAWGMESVIPRVLKPDKRDSEMGNFFARTVGADIGVSDPLDFTHNISIAVPFEVLGNFGVVAGVLSFALIGVFWPVLSIWMLSPARLSNHPLTPYLVLATMSFESSFGGFLDNIRGMLVPITLIYVLRKIMPERSKRTS